MADATAGTFIPDITVTALDGLDAVDSSFDFAGAIVASTLGSAPVGPGTAAAGTLTDNGGGIATISGAIGYGAKTGRTITVTSGSVTGSSNTFSVLHAPLAALVMSPATPTTITADQSQAYTTIGTDAYGNTFDATGDTSLGIAPPGTCDNPVPHQCFARTVGVYTVTGTVSSSSDSSALSVTPGALEYFTIDNVATQVAGTAFDVVVKAYDQWGNIKIDYTGGATLSGLVGTSSCLACVPVVGSATASYAAPTFTDGVATVSVTAVKAVSSAAEITVADGAKSNVSNTFTVTHSLVEGGVTIDSIVSQVAGNGFTVTVRAFDEFGNVRVNASGGILSGLAASLGCAGCNPVIASGVAATYTPIVWGGGVGTSTVTAVRTTNNDAQIAANVGSKSNTSNLFSVTAAGLSQLVFSNTTVGFNGQPIDTKSAQPIDSVCNPYFPAPATPPTNPCNPATSIATKVLAVDGFGNRVSGISVVITSSPTGVTGGAALATSGGTDPTAAGFGEVSFANLTIGALGSNNRLIATSGLNTVPSNQFRIVDDLTACQSTVCVNKSGNSARAAYGKITAKDGEVFFGAGRNVNLTTAFVSNTQTQNQCKSLAKQTVRNAKPIGPDATELRVIGLGVTDSGPTTSMLIVIPKAVLKASGVLSRGTPSFDVCLGTIWIGAGTPSAWTGKDPAITSGTQAAWQVQDSAALGGLTRYWGVPRDCTAAIRATNPCISLRTKMKSAILARLGPDAAALMNDSDLGIIIEKPTMWDGKGGVY